MKLTQENLILNYLLNGGQLVSSKARSIGVANPSAVVNNLRNKGHSIYSNVRKTGGRRTYWTLSADLPEIRDFRDFVVPQVVG